MPICLVADERAWSAPVLAERGVNPGVVRARLLKVYGHLLVQPSAAPDDASSLLHVVLTSEPENKDLLRPSSEEI